MKLKSLSLLTIAGAVRPAAGTPASGMSAPSRSDCMVVPVP